MILLGLLTTGASVWFVWWTRKGETSANLGYAAAAADVEREDPPPPTAN